MIVDYATIVRLLEESGLPDQDAPPGLALSIRFRNVEKRSTPRNSSYPAEGYWFLTSTMTVTYFQLKLYILDDFCRFSHLSLGTS